VQHFVGLTKDGQLVRHLVSSSQVHECLKLRVLIDSLHRNAHARIQYASIDVAGATFSELIRGSEVSCHALYLGVSEAKLPLRRVGC